MLSALQVGNKVDIKSTAPIPEGQRRKVYASQVVEIIDSISLKITVPTLGTQLVPLAKGQRFVCSFSSAKGLLEGEFVAGERMRDGNLPVIVLEIRTPLKKVQRREYFRYDCTLPMKYRYADRDEKIPKDQLSKQDWKDGVILDLSGGGMRFVTQESIPRDSYVQFKLVLMVKGNYREFYIYGDVIHSKTKENNVKLHECRTQFMKLSEAERDMIIGYIFEEQRKKRSMN